MSAKRKPFSLDMLNSHEYSRDEFWEGTFDEYLDIASQNPAVAYSAYQRLYQALVRHEFSEYTFAREKFVHWNFCDDPVGHGVDAIYGLDRQMMRLVNVIKAGAARHGQERRIILMHGPVGGSKSTVARLLRKLLEFHTKTPEGQVFTHDWVVNSAVLEELTKIAQDSDEPVGDQFRSLAHVSEDEVRRVLGVSEHQDSISCPLHEDPFMLLPSDVLVQVENRLNAVKVSLDDDDGTTRPRFREETIKFEGTACPLCRLVRLGLLRVYQGDWQKILKNHVRIRRFTFSEVDRVGLGSFRPKDEKNQDSTELTGDINLRRIAEYGVESDPRAFNFDGEFQVSHRGIFCVEEIFKLDKAFLYDFLGASQEHVVKPKRFAEMYIDTVLIGSTNDPEYKKLVEDETMEAFKDRTTRVDIPYVVDLREEQRIYKKVFTFGSNGKHIAPHTIEVASMWSVLTRIQEPKKVSMSLLDKLKIYSGQTVAGFGEEEVRELLREAEGEAMFGISPRYIQDSIGSAIVADPDDPCVTPFVVLKALREGLATHSLIKASTKRDEYTTLLSIIEQELNDILKSEVQQAIAADKEAVAELFSTYIDNVVAYVNHEKVPDPVTREDKVPNERLMREVEEKMNVPDNAKDEYRARLVQSMGTFARRGKEFNVNADEQLRRGIQLKLFDDRKDAFKLETLHTRVVNTEDQKKIDTVKTRLIEQFGYCDTCANVVLHQVASIFSRGDPPAKKK